MVFLTCVLLLLQFPAELGGHQHPTAQEIFSPFNGNWRGTFKTFSIHGKLQDEIQVEQRYWWHQHEQQAVFIERKKDGTVTRSKARNYLKKGKLFCEVINDERGRTVHEGYYENGLLFWHRRLPDQSLTESFKERVIDIPGGREYQIDGVGIYGTAILIFEGRYHEIK
jgi:hypothetical protein